MKTKTINREFSIVDNEAISSSTLVVGLKTCLADSYVLMMKTQSCHWNVRGPMFHSVHQMTQLQYEDLFVAIDDIAERIRALGYNAPSSLKELVQNASIHEDTAIATAEEMLESLASDHRSVAEQFCNIVGIAESTNDTVTADLLTTRMAFHEKTAWMLEATLTD